MKIPGFEFSGICCGIKGGGARDLALIHSVKPAVVVGAFTSNRFQAAPVLVSRKNIRSGLCSAIIINSGNANACTGSRGLRNAETMVAQTAENLGVPRRQVLVCSTGKIGVPLPIGRIVRGIPGAVRSLSESRFMEAARAILTTDQGPKTAFFKGRIGGKVFHLAGFAKGAGMIAPDLGPSTGSGQATMLAFFFTDLSVSRSCLSQVFELCVDRTFNSITVDGDTSTNDTVLLMTNGLAGNRPIQRGTVAAKLFEKALREVMRELALKIVEDGEGGTKCVRIEVKGAKSNREAEAIARTIGNSPLVKTAFFGEDPNWGRILAAAGRAPATCDPKRTDLYYNGVCVVRKGVGTGVAREAQAKKVMKKRRFQVTIDFHLGHGRGCIWASDLTVDYVKLNSHYRT